MAATHIRRRQRDWAILRSFGLAHTGYGWVDLLDISQVDREAVVRRLKTSAQYAHTRVLPKPRLIGQIGCQTENRPARIGGRLKGVGDARARNGTFQQRGPGGQFGAKWPEHVPKEIPPDEIDRVDRELEEAERMRPNPPQQQPQEQKNSGHDAQRRIPTVVPAPSGDGSADAAQPAWKNIWELVEHYRANPAAAARVRAESAAEGSGMPAAAPRPRLVAAQAPREVRSEPRPTQPPAKDYRQRDDATRADPTWLAFTLTRSKHLAPLMRSDLVRAGYNRGTWRAAVGGLLARAPGTVDNPAGFVHGIMRSLVSGTERDPRTKPGYFAHEGWGAPARQFACVE